MISVFDKKEECCGCTACKHICPTKAIEMKIDEEGFLYPEINQEVCIDCGLCRKVCAFQNGYDESNNFDKPYAYGVKHTNNDIRMESRSGGMFTAISDLIINKDGVIYGVGYNENSEVCHKKAISKIERDEFRGSKYVQSNLNDIFLDIENELIKGIKVLFTGTPCQTAGLREYIHKKKVADGTLLICDIVCHGTPSPKLFKDYISYLEGKHNSGVANFDFRNKKLFGWQDHTETYDINTKTYNCKIYRNLFYEHSALRPSCYNCKYTNMIRPSDITLADFWGIDDIIDGFNDNKGVSLVFFNTEKGFKTFDEVKKDLNYVECTGESFIHTNLKEPTKKPENRELFWKDYHDKGFKFIAKKYGGYTIKSRTKRVLIEILKKLGMYDWIKRVVKG